MDVMGSPQPAQIGVFGTTWGRCWAETQTLIFVDVANALANSWLVMGD